MNALATIISRGSPDDPAGQPIADAPAGMRLFTPGLGSDWRRIVLHISPADQRKNKRGKGHMWTVIDEPTGVEFDVESAPCGAGCYCAASVTTIRFPD